MEQQLYELPEGWSWKKFQDVCQLKRGYDLPKKSRIEGKHPLFSANGVTDYINQWKVKGPGVVTGRSGTIGKVHFVDADYWPLNTALYVEDFKGNDERFIHFFLESFDLNRFSSGASVPTLNRNSLSAETVCVPDTIDEQKRIVAKLDALFTRIDAGITHLQETLELSKALFASALVKSFEEDPNWHSTKIKEVFNVVNGRAYKKQELLDSGKYKVVRIQNLKGGETYYYSDLELKSDKYCDAEDLLFSWSGTPGTSFGAFIWKGEKSIYHYHIWKMEPLVKINIRFAYWLLRDLTEEAISSSRGVAGMLHITKGMMESFDVQLPPINEQALVANHLDKLEEHTSTLDAETQERLDQLAALKSSLLDAAFRGQL